MRLVIGRIGRPHGVRGEVAVEVHTDEPDRRFVAGARLETDPPERGPLEIVDVREHAGRLLVRFVGRNDRDDAEALRDVLLCADSMSSPALADPDEYWDHDLVGLRALGVHGADLGEVAEVLHPPGGDLLAVRRPDGKELLVPFVAAIVPEVDVAGRRVVIDPPDGLLDL